MTRLKRFKGIGSAALTAAMILGTSVCTAAKQPNILYIVTDDQAAYDLKTYDPDSVLETPVIDSLAAEGMVIDGAHQMGAWCAGVCTPSRHMIMSGRTFGMFPISRNKAATRLKKIQHRCQLI